MYIKRLTIDNFGSIIHFDVQLPKTIALIETCDSHAVTSAVRILLLYAPIHDVDPPVAAGQCTKLYAEVVVGSLNYQVASIGVPTKISAVRVYKDEAIEATDVYSSVMSRCEEENKISFLPDQIIKHIMDWNSMKQKRNSTAQVSLLALPMEWEQHTRSENALRIT